MQFLGIEFASMRGTSLQIMSSTKALTQLYIGRLESLYMQAHHIPIVTFKMERWLGNRLRNSFARQKASALAHVTPFSFRETDAFSGQWPFSGLEIVNPKHIPLSKK